MIEFRVEVSAEDIIEAKRQRCDFLKVTLKRMFPGALSVNIDPLDCGQSMGGEGKEVCILGHNFSLTFHLSKEVLSFLADFYSGKFVNPFSFMVRLGGK